MISLGLVTGLVLVFLGGGAIGALVMLAVMEYRHECLPHDPSTCGVLEERS